MSVFRIEGIRQPFPCGLFAFEFGNVLHEPGDRVQLGIGADVTAIAEGTGYTITAPRPEQPVMLMGPQQSQARYRTGQVRLFDGVCRHVRESRQRKLTLDRFPDCPTLAADREGPEAKRPVDHDENSRD